MLSKSLLVAFSLTVVTSAAASDIADAVRRGDKEAVRTLVAAKADVNAPQGDGMTALHWAAYNDDVEIAESLIRAGAGVQAVTRNGALTPLLVAATNGSAGSSGHCWRPARIPTRSSTDGATPPHDGGGVGQRRCGEAVARPRRRRQRERYRGRAQTPLMFAAAADSSAGHHGVARIAAAP